MLSTSRDGKPESSRLVGEAGSDWLALLAAGSSRLGVIEERMEKGIPLVMPACCWQVKCSP